MGTSELLVWMIAASLLVAGGVLLLFGHRKSSAEAFFRRARAGREQDEAVPRFAGSGLRLGAGHLFLWFERAGWMSYEQRARYRLLALALLSAMLGSAALGAWHIAIAIGAAIALAFALAWKKGNVRRDAVRNQVPALLDSLIRGLEVGMTVDAAFRMAVDMSTGPIRPVLSRVRTRVELGESLGEALRHAARVQACRELHLLGFILDMHQRHGGKASEMLGGLARTITVDQQMRRDLRALTAETRFTALVLIALPIGMAAYLLATNPDYLLLMWEHDTGVRVLVLAAAMQVVGSLLIWRLSNPQTA